MATIIRGADTGRFDLAPQSAGLWAISAGLSYNFRNDHEMLENGIKVYDALYSWAAYAQEEKHTWKEAESQYPSATPSIFSFVSQCN